jgi:hypothetical protein
LVAAAVDIVCVVVSVFSFFSVFAVKCETVPQSGRGNGAQICPRLHLWVQI